MGWEDYGRLEISPETGFFELDPTKNSRRLSPTPTREKPGPIQWIHLLTIVRSKVYNYKPGFPKLNGNRMFEPLKSVSLLIRKL